MENAFINFKWLTVRLKCFFVDSIILWLRYIFFVDDDAVPLLMDDDAVPFSDAAFIYEYQESSRYLQYYAELQALRLPLVS